MTAASRHSDLHFTDSPVTVAIYDPCECNRPTREHARDASLGHARPCPIER